MEVAVYLGRRGTHFVFRLTLQGKPVIAYYPAWLVDRWGPHPIDCTAVAHGDERVSSPVPVSERVAAFGEFGEHSVARESEKQGSVTLPANEILGDGTIAR
jgi:hypothetical protein